MKFLVRIEATERAVEVSENNGLYRVEVDGKTYMVDSKAAGGANHLSMLIDNRSHLIECEAVRVDEGQYTAQLNGRRYAVDVLDERLVASRRAATTTDDDMAAVVLSPMPGLIVDVKVKVGDSVTAGTPVVVMEAMKMQNELVAEIDGVVTAVKVTTQESVESQTPLIEIEKQS